MTSYDAPSGGLPPQTALMTGRAVFTTAYAVIPKGCFSDIVVSYLPGWARTRLWLIARPMSGFSETFSQYVMEVSPGGGSDAPDAEPGAEHWLFFTGGLQNPFSFLFLAPVLISATALPCTPTRARPGTEASKGTICS